MEIRPAPRATLHKGMFRSKSPHTYIKELDRAREPAMTMPTPRLVIFTLGGTLAYLGLAILGWAGFSAFSMRP